MLITTHISAVVILELGPRLNSAFCPTKKNCNRTRFMIKQLNLNRFQQNLQKITLNNLAINVQNFENWQSY